MTEKMILIDFLHEIGYVPKRKASTHGGEFCSPCPFCQDGDDRFLIWPQRKNRNGEYRGGRFSCRICGKYGDAIAFLHLVHGLTYPEACARLCMEPKFRNHLKPKLVPKLQAAPEPSKIWSDKASSFVDWCHEKLKDSKALEQVKKRGIKSETIEKFKIGYCPIDFWRHYEDWGLSAMLKDDGKPKKLWIPAGIVIPTFASDGQVMKVKVRRTGYQKDLQVYEKAVINDKTPKRKPQKYIVISGSQESPSVYGNKALSCALVLESELDAIVIQQEAVDLVYCVALGGSSKPLDAQTDLLLRKAKLILFLPDFDKAGAIAWRKWQAMFPAIQRILTPSEKSAGDYFQNGGNLREWLEDCIKEIQKKFNI